MNAEENRNKRRDKKIQRKKTGMRVDNSARKLAEILRNKGFRGTKEELESFAQKAPTIHEIVRDALMTDPEFKTAYQKAEKEIQDHND